ncbi:MAG: nicotinamide-nucleotide amidohydrolase family protein, partial [Planctomycetes bacterium]|nr:nicotinamide-nucleotide amidohydrolase family protein [Planctomycetota bacterium]
WITYRDDLKSRCLGVPAQMLREHGAVSEVTARSMAEGALAAAAADYALAVTGVAGPEGGTPQKPVGRVYVALSRKGGAATTVRSFDFPPDRASVRDRSARSALQILRFALLEIADDVVLLWEAPVRDSAAVC